MEQGQTALASANGLPSFIACCRAKTSWAMTSMRSYDTSVWSPSADPFASHVHSPPLPLPFAPAPLLPAPSPSSSSDSRRRLGLRRCGAGYMGLKPIPPARKGDDGGDSAGDDDADGGGDDDDELGEGGASGEGEAALACVWAR